MLLPQNARFFSNLLDYKKSIASDVLFANLVNPRYPQNYSLSLIHQCRLSLKNDYFSWVVICSYGTFVLDFLIVYPKYSQMCPYCLVMHLPIAVRLQEGKAIRKVNAVSTSSADFHSLFPVFYCHDPVYQSHTFPNIKSNLLFYRHG